MGCGGSKDSGEGDNTIESEMKTIGIQKFDDFFGNASTILSNAEDIRSGLQDSKEEMEELTNVHFLKEPHLVDAVQAWLWCLSANGGGHISKAQLSIEDEAPYVALDGSEYFVEVISFQNALKTYLKTVLESPEKFQEIFEQFQGIADQAPSMGDSLKDEAAGLNPLQLGRALAACAKNVATVASGMKKMTLVKDALQNASKDLPILLKQAKDLISKADEGGKQCIEQKKLRLNECIEVHLKEKKTTEEMAAHNKGKKKGKGKKKEGKGAQGGHNHGSGPGQHTHGKKEEHK